MNKLTRRSTSIKIDFAFLPVAGISFMFFFFELFPPDMDSCML